jgi:hypothetical protein
MLTELQYSFLATLLFTSSLALAGGFIYLGDHSDGIQASKMAVEIVRGVL